MNVKTGTEFKNMKKLIILLLIVTAFNVVAKAQFAQKSPEKRAAHMTKALQKSLNLTADQSDQINSAFLTQVTRMDSLKGSPSTNKRAYNYSRKQIMQSSRQQIMSVLSGDQQKQFIELEKAKKEKHLEKKSAMMDAQG
jgi:Spy/CpxP family protein refolding chaperone